MLDTLREFAQERRCAAALLGEARVADLWTEGADLTLPEAVRLAVRA